MSSHSQMTMLNTNSLFEKSGSPVTPEGLSHNDGATTSLKWSMSSRENNISEPHHSNKISNFFISPLNSLKHNLTAKLGKGAANVSVDKEVSQLTYDKLSAILKSLDICDLRPLRSRRGSLFSHSSKKSTVYLASSCHCLYLPASVQSRNGDRLFRGSPIEIELENSNSSTTYEASFPNINRTNICHSDNDDTTDSLSSLPAQLQQKLRNLKSPDLLCSNVEKSKPIPHTFAIIIKLSEELSICNLSIELQSHTNISYPSKNPYDRTYVKESFNIGYLKWKPSFKDPDYFISLSSTNNDRVKNITTELLAERTMEYRLLETSTHSEKEQNIYESLAAKEEVQEPGYYIFLFPLIFPGNIPPSIETINGGLNHELSVQYKVAAGRLSGNYKSSTYDIPMVRSPSNFCRAANIERTWNDSFYYIISIPSQCLSLGTAYEISLQIKASTDTLRLEHISIEILEHIKYVSQDFKQNYEYDDKDPWNINPSHNGSPRLRTIKVLEIGIKSPGINMFLNLSEDVTSVDNLLQSDKKLVSEADNYSESENGTSFDKRISVLLYGTASDKRRSSYFKKNEQNSTQSYSPSLATYLDSNYRHIQVHHRLQFRFKILKVYSTQPNKRYEIIASTPITILSSQCDLESINLPRYSE